MNKKFGKSAVNSSLITFPRSIPKTLGILNPMSSGPINSPTSAPVDALALIRSHRCETKAWLDKLPSVYLSTLSETDHQKAQLQATALVLDFLSDGCNLVLLKRNPIANRMRIGDEFILKRPDDLPRRVLMRWEKPLNELLLNAGFQFI